MPETGPSAVVDGLFREAWDAERARGAARLNLLRLIGIAAWFAMAWIFGYGMHLPDWSAMAPVVTGYLAVTVVIFTAGRLAPRLLRFMVFSPAAVDVPMVFWIVWRVLAFSPTPREASQFTIGIFCVLVVFALLSLSRRTIALAALAGAVGEILLLQRAGITFDTQLAAIVILGIEALGAVFIAGRILQVVRKIAEESALRERMGRNFAPGLLAELRGARSRPSPGEERTATIMFADIPGFSALTAGAESAKVVAWLNEYFTDMVQVIFRHGGTLDKFMGDGLLAYFGVPTARGKHSHEALMCAIDMLEAVKVLNARRASRKEPALAIGIGLHTGTVVVGDIGSDQRLELSIIGDAVNIASRLKQEAKLRRLPILVSGATHAELKTQFAWTPQGELVVPEAASPIRLFTPSSVGPTPAVPVKPKRNK